MTTRKFLVSSTALSVCFGIVASPALAQTAAAAADNTPSGLEEIIVTARRTSENLQTVPVAVTALGAEALQNRQVLQVTDLIRVAPSLSVNTGGTGPASLVSLAIRGQAQNSPNSLSDASVGIYIDGVYVARPIIGNLGFFDIATAEVLRGPQGTLFGRNTTGGALNITTNQPTDRLEGNIRGGLGNYRSRQIEGVVNLPFGDEFAVRFAGRYNENDGYFPNPTLGIAQGAVEGAYFFRATAKYSPKAVPATLTISGDYSLYNDNGNALGVAAINPASPLAAFTATSVGVQNGTIAPGAPGPFGIPAGAFVNFARPGTDPTLQRYINPEFTSTPAPGSDWKQTFGGPRTGNPEIDTLLNRTEAKSVSGTLDADLGPFSVKSISAYRTSEAKNSLDLTGTPTSGGAFVSEYINDQFSQEIQFSGKSDKLDWIVGLYYFYEDGTERSTSSTFYNTPIAARNQSLASYSSESKGLFAQMTYHATDALRLTGGFRYTWDNRTIQRKGIVDWRAADPVCNVGANAGRPASVAVCFDPDQASFSYPAWLASADYKINDDIFVYAKTSGASMSGGFNSRPVPPPFSGSFDPEKVRDIEAGFKGEFFDRKLRTNVAVFHAWQSDVQRIVNVVIPPNTLTQFVANQGDARMYGVEIEGSVLPWTGMDITGGFAYLNASYVAGTRNETQLVGGKPVVVDRSGEPITQAPEFTWNLGATQTFDIGPGALILHADYAYISSRALDAFTTGNPAQAAAVAIANEASIVKGYGLLNGRIAFTLNNPKIEIAVWGRNLTDQAWFTNVFNSYTGIGATVQATGQPRTYGVTLGFTY